jgi:glucose dehydrogenase
MTKVIAKITTEAIKLRMKKTLSNTSITALALAILFIFSGVGAALLINPVGATPNAAAPAAAVPAAPSALTQAEANWAYPNGNALNQNYNPQNQINSSDAQYLGLSWIYPLPDKPLALSSTGAGGVGVGMGVLIVNGTAYATTVFDETIAFNVANGDVLWTFITPLAVNSTQGLDSGTLTLHSHDGNEAFTTAHINSAVSGPTLWLQGQDYRIYAISAVTGKAEMNFTDFTGDAMVPGNNPGSIYHAVGASNILIDQAKDILITGHDAEADADNGRGFFAGWNLSANPPTLAWLAYTTPPQPGGSVPLNPNWDTQMIANMSAAYTFFPGKNGSTNDYTTPTELAGGVLVNHNNDIVVNWKNMSATELNATLYNDWGQVDQSSQCLAIDAGGSTGSTGSGWGGPWLLGSGQSNGMAFVTTNNKDPFTGPCNPGPDLWSASVLALNVTNGHWIWGLQTTTHDVWDYDCSWWQGMGNETISGVSTEVIFKTCKNGYLYEINALTGNLIWAWDPPVSDGFPRCPLCYPMDPTNKTQTGIDFPTALTSGQSPTGPQPAFLQYPSELAGFEDQQAYDPATNTLYAAAHIVPYYMTYLGLNSSTYFTSTGETGTPTSHLAESNNNATIFAINAATGAINWKYFIPNQGYRGGVTTSGNLVFATLSSGDILMINAANGTLVRDDFIGTPMNELATIGATTTGQEMLVVPVGTCGAAAITTCPGTTPGDIIALTLQNLPTTTAAGGKTVTQSVTSTATTTISGASGGTTITTVVSGSGSGTTVTKIVSGGSATVTTTVSGSGASGVVTVTSTTTSTGGGVSSATLYGVAAVAVIFIIATGYLAMRGRKPAS